MLIAAEHLDKLKQTVVETAQRQKVEDLVERLAVQRIEAARKELALALAAIIPITAKSEETRQAAKAALAELVDYEKEHKLPE